MSTRTRVHRDIGNTGDTCVPDAGVFGGDDDVICEVSICLRSECPVATDNYWSVRFTNSFNRV